ncbi:MAG: hypothetical protein A3C50_03710 [Candidatus Staskawiczbacteria bacterium RIFCSPHIGHO2_02_FULL_43_16]|uniref:Uncharacterized protein n=1 Tax=Candidatus Staskawiczbacteria bacterium RIFCSPHIGHO2_01_FULL_41_41 TaxID=1802203 RepID=A0A1G2HSP4_9BACT|nr:MAG: hypothetical protein A2822_02815 [Candidatus Staskawiczbacteria bacterium RIFCSPHIGHO2_01_FULL_41_41]OGZ68042.1 MAG: hypothetical protein A3C50_03710 [Candidatus Staskawiczbacteria bacterium RIFCSPHIGHO2_02_FULL_43_16]OGZ74778.1 MAG: hypothetical protein A3A12_02895 [Candidatus Staskawiczbacteria bacterium RIFCSPLOWO2_01_FULL_43_17b]
MKKQKNNTFTRKELVDILDTKFKENQRSLLKSVGKKLEANQESMAGMVKTALQGTQDLIIKRFDEKIDGLDKNIKEIHKEVQKINLNAVDVVRKEEFDNLESRVADVEEIVDLRLKKS